MTALDVRTLNAATPAAFAAAVAPLFEGAPRFLARLAEERPFDDWDGLFEIARAIAHVMPEDEQVELVDAHPRLGAPPASMSALSSREQGHAAEMHTAGARGHAAEVHTAGARGHAAEVHTAGARGHAADEHTARDADDAAGAATVATELERLNDAYERRFGFRYCVFVAGRPRASLLPEMSAALGDDRQAELHRALDAVIDIARARRRAVAEGS